MPRTLDPETIPLHLDRLRRAARAMTTSSADAEDLVQETCVRLLSRPRRIDEQDAGAYLVTALRNTSINHWRSASRRHEVVGIPEHLEPRARAHDGALEDHVRTNEILGWIGELPTSLATPLVAIDVAGMSLTETASRLGLSERDVRGQLGRARIAIGSRLRPAG